MSFAEKHPIFWPLAAAAGLALLGILNLPYGYYEFLRWVLTGASILLAVYAWRTEKKAWLALAVPIFILWFPPFQIFMDKSAWVVLDLLAGAALIWAGLSIQKDDVRS
jgi:hypothetical protein